MAGSSRRERSARLGITFLVAAIAAIAWIVASPPADDTLPTKTQASAAEPAPPPVTTPLAGAVIEQPAQRRTSMSEDSGYWLDSLTAPEEEPRAAADDDPNAAVLRGRLTVRQQQWLHPAGVEIRLTRSWLDSVIPTETGPEQRAPLRDEPRTITDGEGRFAFRFLPGGGEVFLLIGHRTEWQDFQKVRKQPRRGTELDVGDVWLDQRGGIVGRLTSFGRPLAGMTLRAVDDPLLGASSAFDELRLARVEGLAVYRAPGTLRGGPVPDWVVRRDRFLPFPTATTDNNGVFHLRGLRPGSHDVFVIAGPRHGSLLGDRRGVLVAAGRDTDVGTIEAEFTRSIELCFVDEQDKPWIGAEVALVHRELGFGCVPVRTDANGRALIVSPAPEQASLVFCMPGGGPWLQLPWNHEQHQYIIHVPRAGELRVMLADEGGRLLAGGKVRTYVVGQSFRPVDRALAPGMQPVEQEPGLHVGRCPSGLDVIVVAAVPGFAPAISRTRARALVSLTMLRMQTMTVRTHDLQNQPVAGATVRMQVHANPDLTFPGAQWDALANDRVLVGRTNDVGELTVPAWPTYFSLHATHPDHAPSAGPKVFGVPDQRLDLLMRGAGDIVGHLTIQQRAAPRGLRVVARQKPPPGHPLEQSGWLDERRAVTGDGGAFAFRNLCAGTAGSSGAKRVSPGFRSLQVLLDEGQERHCVLEAQNDGLGGPCITGVVLQDGAALAGAVVRLRALPPPPDDERRRVLKRHPDLARYLRPSPSPSELMPWTHRCDTEVCGDFAFHDLAAGAEFELRLDVLRDGYLQFVARRVVQAGTNLRPARVDFSIATGHVHLSCTRNGESYGNRMFRLRQTVGEGGEGARFDVLVDGHGLGYVDSLPCGEWTIEPAHGGRCEPGEFTLSAGQAIVLPIAVKDH